MLSFIASGHNKTLLVWFRCENTVFTTVVLWPCHDGYWRRCWWCPLTFWMVNLQTRPRTTGHMRYQMSTAAVNNGEWHGWSWKTPNRQSIKPQALHMDMLHVLDALGNWVWILAHSKGQLGIPFWTTSYGHQPIQSRHSATVVRAADGPQPVIDDRRCSTLKASTCGQRDRTGQEVHGMSMLAI